MKYYYCYNTKIGLFDKEIEYATYLEAYIFYDKDKDAFFDKNNNPVDIKSKLLFPRSSISQSKILVDAIIRHGGIPLVKKEDYDKTLNWPYYIKTKRNNIILSGRQIIDNPELISSIFGNNSVFFKTKHKNFSQIIPVSNFFAGDSSFLRAIEVHQDDDFIISDAVSIDKDEHGPLEYRAFIINGEIFNISRVSDSLLGVIPKEVIGKLKEVVSSLKETDFPTSYVVDIFIYKDKEERRVVVLLECNPIIASGVYLYNSIFEKSNDLEHLCPSASIPKEKLKYKSSKEYSYNIVDNIVPSIFYNLPGGFASDLTAISLFGYIPQGQVHLHFSDQNLSNPLELESSERSPITCDETLLDSKKRSKKKPQDT